MERRKRRILAKVLLVCMVFLTGCQSGQTADKEPVNISIWHVYGGQADSPMNDMIDVFNATIGRNQNIHVETTMISNTNNIHDDVLAAANGDPGAAELPDIFISYPKTVLAMPDREVLVDLKEYFTEEELAAYIPAFLEEGMIDEKLLILPVAKSTEVLFINKTAFDRFAAATGAKVSDLETWEGLFRTAVAYTEWTDSLTPDVSGDGKAFFVHDYHFDYFQVGAESLGEHFFAGKGISFDQIFEKMWKPYAEAALQGAIWLYEGYATDPLRIGDAIASVASSASVLYYSDIVTYADNTSEDIEIVALPCPVFQDGENMVMQRGAGACVVRSTPEKEKAAATFLKWLTDPKCNTEFVTKAGYMPVTEEAFAEYLQTEVETLTEPKYQSLYQAFMDTNDAYTFYTMPQLETYLELETVFEHNVRMVLTNGKEEYEASEGKEEALGRIVEKTMKELAAGF